VAFVGSLSGSVSRTKAAGVMATEMGITSSLIIGGAFADDLYPGSWPGEDVVFFVSGSSQIGGRGSGPTADFQRAVKSANAVFGGDLVVSGGLYVSGSSGTGGSISGSLQRTSDGVSYLVAGSNMTVTSASNGQITLAASAGGSAGGSDTQLQYNNGGSSFGGLATLTWDNTNFLLGNGTDTKLQFRDAGLYIYSQYDGYLNLEADSVLALSGSGAVPNAVRIETSNPAGGIDIDAGTRGVDIATTGKLHVTSSINSGDSNALQFLATNGGIEMTANGGGAGEDFNISSTRAINLTSLEDTSNSIYIHANGGTSEQIKIHSENGTAATAIHLSSQVGGITLTTDPGENIIVDALSISPDTDNITDLGSASKRFANIYTGDLHLANERGDWTVIEENDYLTLRNNKTGKRFKLLMETLPDDDE